MITENITFQEILMDGSSRQDTMGRTIVENKMHSDGDFYNPTKNSNEPEHIYNVGNEVTIRTV